MTYHPGFLKVLALMTAVLAIIPLCTFAQSPHDPIKGLDDWDPKVLHPAKQYVIRTFKHNGKEIDEVIVPGRPPASFRAEVASVPLPETAAGINVLPNVPAFDWCYGCSATSAAMMMGYYDNNGYPNMYTGPANGGVCPMTNAVWGYGECPLSATHAGKDGRVEKGHVDDYWRAIDSCEQDPWIEGWPEHIHGDCTADFMGTNQSDVDNCDGATTFYFNQDGTPTHDYIGAEFARRDGSHGMKLFAQSRGYPVLSNYSQYIQGYNGLTQGFTFNDFMAEINAGHPVLIQVSGHSMVGYGYNTTGNIVYIHDTWDHNSHTMTWGGSYCGMQHYGVTVFWLPTAMPTFSPNGGTYVTPPAVTISSTTPGAVIRYTLDGSNPTASSTLYTGPVTITRNCTLKAIAWQGLVCPSYVKSSTYTVTGDMTTSKMKSQVNTILVGCESAIVSAAFKDYLYIESDDRSCGIRVEKPSHGITSGRVRVIGNTNMNANYERYINATILESNGSGSVEPLVLTNRDVGGTDWPNSQTPAIRQKGIAGASGLCNIGLLVRTVGKVTHSGSGFFYIDDGSRVKDDSGYTGVRVQTNGFTSPAPGSFCAVTGVSSCFLSNNNFYRLILTRSASDVQPSTGAMISGKVADGIITVVSTIESMHPYQAYRNYAWTITAPPGTSRMRIHFTRIELGKRTRLYLGTSPGTTIQTYDSTTAYDVWSDWINGNVIKMDLYTSSEAPSYGFQVDRYEYDFTKMPIAGVSVSLTPGERTTVTDPDGAFYFSNLPAGTYTITPSLAGATFTPASRAVSVATGQFLPDQVFTKN